MYLYVPGLIKILIHWLLPDGTELMAAWMVLKWPRPPLSTTTVSAMSVGLPPFPVQSAAPEYPIEQETSTITVSRHDVASSILVQTGIGDYTNPLALHAYALKINIRRETIYVVENMK